MIYCLLYCEVNQKSEVVRIHTYNSVVFPRSISLFGGKKKNLKCKTKRKKKEERKKGRDEEEEEEEGKISDAE